MKNLIDNIRKLFKVYGLLTSNNISINLNTLGLKKGSWYVVNMIAKRTNEGAYLDEMSIFQLKTKVRAKNVSKKLKSHYKLS